MSDAPPERILIGDDGKLTILLAVHIEAYGDKIDRLILRRPTGKEIRVYGNPIKITAGGDVDAAKVLKYAELLGGVPASALDQLDTDYMAVELAVIYFFGPKDVATTSSTATTTSPGSGASTLSPSSPSTSVTSLSLSDRRSA